MRPVLSAVKAVHYLATAFVLTSLLLALQPAAIEPFMTRGLDAMLHSYASLRGAGFEKLGAGAATVIAALRHWLAFPPPAPWFRTPPVAQDAVLACLLLVPSFLSAREGAVKLRVLVDDWREKRGIGGRYSLFRRLTTWRVIASDAAFIAFLLALGLYYLFMYGVGLAGVAAAGAALDRFVA